MPISDFCYYSSLLLSPPFQKFAEIQNRNFEKLALKKKIKGNLKYDFSWIRYDITFAQLCFMLFSKRVSKHVTVPRTKQPQQLTRPLLELLIRMIHNLCCPKTPCAAKKRNSNEQGLIAPSIMSPPFFRGETPMWKGRRCSSEILKRFPKRY